MIDELIRKELEEMLEALEEFEQVRNEYDGLKTREKELNEIIEQTGVFTGKTIKVVYPTPIKEQKFNLFQRLFSKKYKEYMGAKEEYHAKCAIAEETEKRLWKEREEEHESAKAELDQVRSGIAKCEEFITSTDWQSMRQKQLDLADKEKAVQILIDENPELAKT